MHKDNLIVAVKANGKILREFKDTTYVPFGTQYSILIKNLESKRALVKVWIDGTDATEGTSLVIDPNSEIELERFIRNGNLKEGNKFKFIEKTTRIEQHRGSKIDDGFIRVEWQFELKTEEKHVGTVHHHWNHYSTYPYYTLGGSCGSVVGNPFPGMMTSSVFNDTLGQSSVYSNTASASTVNAASAINTTQSTVQSVTRSLMNDAGITVPGSHSTQEFKPASWFALESIKHVITLKLLGETPEGKKVETPVTVKSKPSCLTCGRTNKATSKFCSECGTSLTIF